MVDLRQMDALRLELKSLVIEVSRIPDVKPEAIDNEALLFDSAFGLDSIDLLELVVHLEKRYDLKIKNDDEGRAILANINGLASAIMKKRYGNESMSCDDVASASRRGEI